MTGEFLYLLAEQLANLVYRHVQGAVGEPLSDYRRTVPAWNAI